MASPVSIGCPLSPTVQEQRTKTFSKNAFKPSLHGASSLNIDDSSPPCSPTAVLEENEDNINNEGDTLKDNEVESTDILEESKKVSSPTSPNVGCTPNESTVRLSSSSSSTPHTSEKSMRRRAEQNDLDAFDFALGNDDGSQAGAPILDAFADNVLISSPAPVHTLQSNDLNEDLLRSTIKKMIESDGTNIEMSTKNWMTKIAAQYGVEMLPKEWKGSIRDILVEEATTYTQTQTEIIPAFEIKGNEDESVDSAGEMTPQSKSSLFSDREDGDSPRDDDSNASSPTPTPPPKTKHKESKKPEAEKNEELLVLEKLDADMSERDLEMMEYLTRLVSDSSFTTVMLLIR